VRDLRGATLPRGVEAHRPLTLSFGTSALIQAISVVTGVLLARSLGPHGRGELAAVMLWPGLLAAVGSLGLVESITYHAARDTAPIGTLIGSSLVFGLVQSALLVGAGFIVVSVALSHHSQDVVGSARLFLIYIPVYLLAMYLMSVLNGTHRHSWFQALRLIVIASSAFGLLVLVLSGLGLTLWSALYVYLLAHLLALLIAAGVLRAERSSLKFNARLARQLLGFGMRSHSGNLPSMLNERLDQLLISMFLASDSLGLYVTAVTLTSLTGMVGSSTSLVALPSMAAMAPGRDRAVAARRYVTLTLLGSIAVTIPVAASTPLLLTIFFGQRFGAAAGPCRILLVAAVVLSLNRVLSAILRAAGRPLDAGVAEMIALGGTAVGLVTLLPALGLMGAAVSSLGAYAISMLWMTRQATRVLGLSPSTLLLPDRTALSLLPRITRTLDHVTSRARRD